jgi:hypothetical protein
MEKFKKVKYEKWKDVKSGVYTHNLTLPDGQTFKGVPTELGDYLHKLELALWKIDKLVWER